MSGRGLPTFKSVKIPTMFLESSEADLYDSGSLSLFFYDRKKEQLLLRATRVDRDKWASNANKRK